MDWFWACPAAHSDQVCATAAPPEADRSGVYVARARVE